MSLGVYFSLHKLLVVVAALHRCRSILIYTWRNAMFRVFLSPLWHKLLVVDIGFADPIRVRVKGRTPP
jgi:hypothetical protein